MKELREPLRILAVGDLHGSWDEEDERRYSDGHADLVLWTGDLADRVGEQPRIAQSLARLAPRGFGILGNHDGAPLPLVGSEAFKLRALQRVFGVGHARRVRNLRAILGECEIGFGRRELPELGITVIGVRPLSSGGLPFSHLRVLRRVYGVEDPLEANRKNILEARTNSLVLLGHNGPAGLGTERHSPFGKDWRPEGGDGGDHDYRDAILFARERGKRVLLAVAGHMHNHPTIADENRSHREPMGFLGGTPVLNACWIPRIRRHSREEVWRRHYECLVCPERGLRRVRRIDWHNGREEIRATDIYEAEQAESPS